MLLRNTLVAGGIALATLLGSVPAQAGSSASVTVQFGHPGYTYHHAPRYQRAVLAPREVRRILRARGFREIRFLDRRGSVYQARAENRRGRDVIVTVSARSGEILNVQRLRRGRH